MPVLVVNRWSFIRPPLSMSAVMDTELSRLSSNATNAAVSITVPGSELLLRWVFSGPPGPLWMSTAPAMSRFRQVPISLPFIPLFPFQLLSTRYSFMKHLVLS